MYKLAIEDFFPIFVTLRYLQLNPMKNILQKLYLKGKWALYLVEVYEYGRQLRQARVAENSYDVIVRRLKTL